jgi:hypothetical protein
MTVARLREGAGDNEVMFLESARIYALPRAHPRHDAALRLLRDALAAGRPLRVRLSAPHGDIIESVEDAAPS